VVWTSSLWFVYLMASWGRAGLEVQVQVQARTVVVLDLAQALHESQRGVSVARRLSLSSKILGWLFNCQCRRVHSNCKLESWPSTQCLRSHGWLSLKAGDVITRISRALVSITRVPLPAPCTLHPAPAPNPFLVGVTPSVPRLS
jgi:hypothetical protein